MLCVLKRSCCWLASVLRIKQVLVLSDVGEEKGFKRNLQSERALTPVKGAGTPLSNGRKARDKTGRRAQSRGWYLSSAALARETSAALAAALSPAAPPCALPAPPLQSTAPGRDDELRLF
jgi:hypothetical protein